MQTPKDRFLLKALKLAKKVKPLIGCKWYSTYSQEQADILEDICFMNEDLIDFLLLDDGIATKNDYFNSIDVFLVLECKTFEYKHPLKYKVGAMSQVTKLINMHHDFLDLKTKIGLDG
jgi:NRPS condensation-like uncharacterized protein